MSGNSKERRKELRLGDRILARIPSKYRWDFGSVGVSMSLRFAAGDLPQIVYWIGAMGFYLALLSLGRHVWLDRNWLASYPRVRKSLTLVVVGTVLGMWTYSVFWPNPLEITIMATPGNYPDGTTIGGVVWNSTVDEDGRLNIKNPTDHNYKDIDLYVLSDIWITDTVKLSGIDDVKISRYDPSGLLIRDMFLSGKEYDKDGKGRPFVMPLPTQSPMVISHPTGIRIVADVLHAKSDLELLLVMIAYNRPPVGLPFPDHLFSEKRMPKFATLHGTYKVLGRTWTVDDNINVTAVEE